MKIEGYDILAELGRGGMGEVLLARRRGAQGFEKLVAIKTIRSDALGQEERQAAFLDEARLLARLDHPVTAQVYDFGEAEDVPYLVMEYVAGVPLGRVMEEPWPPVVAAKVITEVCLGMHAAHNLEDLSERPLGVVHRDINPSNLLFTFDGRVKIIDFGIALMRGRVAPATRVGARKGTLRYMSLEQIKNSTVDHRSDIFSAGVVLFELLTHKRPFIGDNPLMLADAIEDGDVPPPSKLEAGVPEALDAITLRALSADPASRYDSAKEMATALAEWVTAQGGCDLEEFAKNHLAEERTKNQLWLRGLSAEDRPLADTVVDGMAPDFADKTERDSRAASDGADTKPETEVADERTPVQTHTEPGDEPPDDAFTGTGEEVVATEEYVKDFLAATAPMSHQAPEERWRPARDDSEESSSLTTALWISGACLLASIALIVATCS